MSVGMAAMIAQESISSAPALSAPSRCPYFPIYISSSMIPDDAVASKAYDADELIAQTHIDGGSCAAPLLSGLRTCASRAPPTPSFC